MITVNVNGTAYKVSCRHDPITQQRRINMHVFHQSVPILSLKFDSITKSAHITDHTSNRVRHDRGLFTMSQLLDDDQLAEIVLRNTVIANKSVV